MRLTTLPSCDALQKAGRARGGVCVGGLVEGDGGGEGVRVVPAHAEPEAVPPPPRRELPPHALVARSVARGVPLWFAARCAVAARSAINGQSLRRALTRM
jgi:hypothetical protein